MTVKRHKSSTLHTVLMTVGCVMLVDFTLPVAQTQAASPAQEITMQVRPRLCVRAPGELMCAMQFSVSWTASIASDVCLTLEGELEPLQCWQAQRQGAFEMQVERQASTLVQLRDANSDHLLQEELIPIISRDLRDTRTRRRHAWSIL